MADVPNIGFWIVTTILRQWLLNIEPLHSVGLLNETSIDPEINTFSNRTNGRQNAASDFQPAINNSNLESKPSVREEKSVIYPEVFNRGFVNGTWPVTINSPTNSLYWRLRDRNLCVHRDYQNLAFNGAKSTTAYRNSLNMTRDEGKDKPVILIYAEFGNDVCTSHHGIPDEMTPVDEFTDAVIEYLEYLDTRLPYNSHVVLVGLVNGTYLYDILKGRLHPIGELNGDVTYDDVYGWFGCMQEVCPGWTNTNVTQQNEATAHAMELSSALKQIASSANYSRFDVHYQDSPLDQAVAQWTGEKWQLIEPVDGLHPSKYGQDLFAKVIWETIEQQYPEILEAVNVNNDKIRQLFGDQGGH